MFDIRAAINQANALYVVRPEPTPEERERQYNEGARQADDCSCPICGRRGYVDVCPACSRD